MVQDQQRLVRAEQSNQQSSRDADGRLDTQAIRSHLTACLFSFLAILAVPSSRFSIGIATHPAIPHDPRFICRPLRVALEVFVEERSPVANIYRLGRCRAGRRGRRS